MYQTDLCLVDMLATEKDARCQTSRIDITSGNVYPLTYKESARECRTCPYSPQYAKVLGMNAFKIKSNKQFR